MSTPNEIEGIDNEVVSHFDNEFGLIARMGLSKRESDACLLAEAGCSVCKTYPEGRLYYWLDRQGQPG